MLTFDGEHAAAMKPGQRVRATLVLEEVDNALVVPRQAISQEAGETRVFVASGDGFEPRRVEIGASSLGLVVVTAGLAEGELIALAPPSFGGESEEQIGGGGPELANVGSRQRRANESLSP